MSAARFIMALTFTVAVCFQSATAQPVTTPVNETIKTPKPFRISTLGKQVSIKSTRDIKSVMVWTSGGHRVLEQKEINSSNYSFRITVEAKIFFVMVQLADGKTYSEKIGLQ